MRSIAVTITAALLLICTLPMMTVQTNVSAADTDTLVLSEVMPTETYEGFTIYNYGTSTIDLSAYTVTDGEGNVTFSSLSISAGMTITVLKAAPPDWVTIGRNIYQKGSNVAIDGNFILADKGDDIYIKKGGNTVDAFGYGNIAPTTGWNGGLLKSVSSGTDKIYQRVSPVDTNSAKDWRIATIGSELFSPGNFTGNVTPFVFPDSKGFPIFEVLESAKTEVLISVYILDHPGIVNILRDLIDNGVDVHILLEGSVLGGETEDEEEAEPDKEKGYMRLLEDEDNSEDNVFFIYNNNSTDKYRRYAYLHNKYAVVDSETVIVTSENWREASFEGNRGWGVIVESTDYAEYMKELFWTDMDPSYGDIHAIYDLFPGTSVSPGTYALPTPGTYTTFNNVAFKPAVAPYHGYNLLNELLEGAESRIFVEIMSLSEAWENIDSPLTRLFNASAAGLDVRTIVDTTHDYKGTVKAFLDSLDGKLNIKAGKESTFKKQIHNKGVVIDDSVWICSMNWNDNSMLNNRETGLIIFSSEVADVYADIFNEDWGAEEVFEGTVTIRVDVPSDVKAGDMFVLDASKTYAPKGAIYKWDLDGDEKTDRTGKKIAVELPTGDHEITLYITDGSDTYTHTFTLTVEGGDDPLIQSWMYITAGIAVLLLILVKIVTSKSKPPKKSSGKNKSSSSSSKSKGKKK